MGAEGIYQRVGERAKRSLQVCFQLVRDREGGYRAASIHHEVIAKND
jgi:hypothetical protein